MMVRGPLLVSLTCLFLAAVLIAIRMAGVA
jgi:hypothetical protein